MTITIELTPEQETALNNRAASLGKKPGEYLMDVALREAHHDVWLRHLYSIGSPGAVLSDEAMRRENIYEE